MRTPRFLTAALLTLAAASAFAMERPFPPVAKRGVMNPAPFPEIVINGQARRMSMGARIFNERNLIQMPASVRGSDLVVNYTEDFQGNIDRVWILTAHEAAQSPVQQRIKGEAAPKVLIPIDAQ